MELLAVNIVSSWVYGSLLMLVSLGLTLVFGLGRVVNFAVGVFYALGAYFMLTLLTHVDYWVCIVAAPPMVAVVGLALERGMIRPIRGRPEITPCSRPSRWPSRSLASSRPAGIRAHAS